jgi:hypothetical protein
VVDKLAIVWAAPRPHIVFIVLVATGIWAVLDWRYGGVIANRDSTIALLTTELDAYKNKLGGASPDQAKARIETLEQKVEDLSKRLGPQYPLTDVEKERLTKVLASVPIGERFHIVVLWPQINGIPHYANDVAQVFSSAKWDATISAAGLTFAHGISFAFSQQAFDDASKRPPEAAKLMALLTLAEIHYDVIPFANIIVPYAFIVGAPE